MMFDKPVVPFFPAVLAFPVENNEKTVNFNDIAHESVELLKQRHVVKSVFVDGHDSTLQGVVNEFFEILLCFAAHGLL